METLNIQSNRSEIVKKISNLQWEIKYYEKSMKDCRFERTQHQIDTFEMYRKYKQRTLEAEKNIETLRGMLLSVTPND